MKFKNESGELWLGDCLELMKDIPDGSVDMILCDLPYGTTTCSWDTIIPFEPLWEHYWRVAKPNAAIVLTASQPFTTSLIGSQIKHFKYCLVWDKVQPTGFLQVKSRPMKRHEDICVFVSNGTPTYNPQMTSGKEIKRTGTTSNSAIYRETFHEKKNSSDERYPVSIIQFSKKQSPNNIPIHTTQKPVALFEYLIKTYTNEGETVLDNCSGSGTTAVAAMNTNRKWICIEKEQKYFDLSKDRIESTNPLQKFLG